MLAVAPQQNSSLSFQGLTKTVGKQFFTRSDTLPRLADVFEKSKGVIGSAPNSWVEKFPKSNRGDQVKDTYKQFAQIIDDYKSHDARFKNDNEMLAQRLVELLKTKEIGENVSLNHVDGASYGRVFRLDVDEKSYALKIFHFKTEKENFINYEDSHGNFWEQANAQHLKKKLGDENMFAEFFFGDVKSGYMLTRFIKDDSPKVRKNYFKDFEEIYRRFKIQDSLKWDIPKTKLQATDIKLSNVKNGWVIDYGGIKNQEQIKRHKISIE
ncbi:MAG: hypothetical protein R3Y28_05780 [Candidatus Gastranaerophilales bacterium]